MEKYDVLNIIGEGSYGLVMKCRHRESGQFVAIKKFLETEDDLTVRKMAIREIRMLKKLRHENLVNMLEVFRRKKRFFLVFEYLEHTILEELESRVGGLGYTISRKYIYQILRALDFIHSHNVIHRDIKPENVLVSRLGVIKLCDFGFARLYTENETFTDYVATRWYRSPELLVGDPRYGKEVDIWAVGCLYAEMMTGEPLFPGESDIDQLFQIIRVLGELCSRHQALITQNSMFKGMKQEQNTTLLELFPDWNNYSLEFLIDCLKMNGNERPTTSQLLKYNLFTKDDFLPNFLTELRSKITQENQSNPLLRRLSLTYNNSSGNRNVNMNSDNSNTRNNKSTAAGATAATIATTTTDESIKTDVSEQQVNIGGATSKDRTTQISSLLSLNANRPNNTTEESFRQSLTNVETFATGQTKQQHHQQQHIKQISINNLIFQDATDVSSNKISHVLSAKLRKSNNLDKSINNVNKTFMNQSRIQFDNLSSPIKFQSLQPINNNEAIQQQQQENLIMQGKCLSPINGNNNHNNISIAGQYFNHQKRNSIIPNYYQKGNNSYLTNSLKSNFPTKTSRSNNLLDVSNYLSTTNNSTISPRILPPSTLSWLISNSNTSNSRLNLPNPHHLTTTTSTTFTNTNNTGLINTNNNKNLDTNLLNNKKLLNDWKTTIMSREPGDFLLPNCPGTLSSISPYKENNKIKLSPMLMQSSLDKNSVEISTKNIVNDNNSSSQQQSNSIIQQNFSISLEDQENEVFI